MLLSGVVSQDEARIGALCYGAVSATIGEVRFGSVRYALVR